MKTRPGQAEKNEKGEFILYEKMRAFQTKCGREASGDEVEVCTFPVTHAYTWKQKHFRFL